MDPSASFELTSGALSLDFVNTWEDRSRPASDSLRTVGDWIAFGRQVGFLGEAEGARLLARAASAPEASAEALARCLAVRDALYRIFSAIARSLPPVSSDLEAINAALPDALRSLQLERKEERFEWKWPASGAALDGALGPILFDAAEILTTAERGRVRECAGSACTWIFLDGSRNGSRRWCSMETCGNRAKARRHYHRRQGSPDERGERPE
jgi:predicted RNA-binding Zn ribbon-like protein